VSPSQLLQVKDAIRAVRLDEAERLARQALELGTAGEIETLVAERYQRPHPLTPAVAVSR
jgi:phosphoenolpyruvate-protein kinase (PTS system EI component)